MCTSSFARATMVSLVIAFAVALPPRGEALTEQNVDSVIQALPVMAVPPVPHSPSAIVPEALPVPPLPQATETQLWMPSAPIRSGVDKAQSSAGAQTESVSELSAQVQHEATAKPGAVKAEAEAKAAAAVAPIVKEEEDREALIAAKAAAPATSTHTAPGSNLPPQAAPELGNHPDPANEVLPNETGQPAPPPGPVSSGVGEKTTTGQPAVTPPAKEAKATTPPTTPHAEAAEAHAAGATTAGATTAGATTAGATTAGATTAGATTAGATTAGATTAGGTTAGATTAGATTAGGTTAGGATEHAAAAEPGSEAVVPKQEAPPAHVFKTRPSKHPNSESGPRRKFHAPSPPVPEAPPAMKVSTTLHSAAPTTSSATFLTTCMAAVAAVAFARF